MATVKNIRWLYKTIKDEETAAQFLCERGLLHSEKLCPVCGETMRLGRGGIAWCCYKRSCRREVSIRMGTWFENKRTKRSWNSMCQTATYPWKVVELDEFLFSRSKYNRGKRYPQQWGFGGTCRETGDAFVVPVEEQSSQTLLSIIQRHVRAGSTVITDERRAYRYPGREACTHLRVNHSVNFVDRATGAHTQSVESLWAQAKRGNKRRCGTHRSALPSHLCEFTWRKRLAASDDAFDAILADILLLRPPRSDGIAYVHPSAAVNAHRSGTYGSRWQCKESRGGTPFDVAEITSGQALYVKAPYSNSLKLPTLEKQDSRSAEDFHSTSATLGDTFMPSKNSKTPAIPRRQIGGVVVVEWPASSSSCSARMYRLRWLMCCENLRLSVNPVSPMEAAEQEHLTPFYDHENVVYIPFEQAFHKHFCQDRREGASHRGTTLLSEVPSLEVEKIAFKHAEGNQLNHLEWTQLCSSWKCTIRVKQFVEDVERVRISSTNVLESFTVDVRFFTSGKEILAKGLNFVPCPRAPSTLDIITSFEHGLASTEQSRAVEIKSAVAKLLLRHRFTQSRNLDHSDISALRNLRANDERIISKANKGNVVVVLDRSTYTDKMNHLLDSSTYCPLRSDPTDRTRKALRSLLLDYTRESKEEKLSTLANHLKHSSAFRCPEMCGLPKIHKPDIPFRPIVCSIRSITCELSSYLKGIILPLVKKRTSTVKDSKIFVEEIRTFRTSPTDILVSYDLKDLFTSIPIPYTLNILHELLYTDSTLPGRTKLSLFQIVHLISFCML
ncbi:hypothetical protein M514_11333 [Trichuris suis]|uniref:ISXO2-like transposase domain-containing protein n=1 Tax=Trichuris suis TaxID=68888 RepID=A0A085MRW7_9BILA|nr:hypothetical protein M514_11333 [Trichuris suis]